jgi:UDP-N-acetylmuramyl pentapeptide phosphotransferase/UDP-N-acetylglucosamine-1-phosphate transferase
VVEQKKLTKGKSALLMVLSAIGAVASATMLHGWHVYLGFAMVGVGILIGFLRWNRRN